MVRVEFDNAEENEWLNPVGVENAFLKVINGIQHGPKPVRAERIWSVFKGNENEIASLEDFTEAFSDSADPKKSATNAIGWLNRTFKRLELPYVIERSTVYQLRKREIK